MGTTALAGDRRIAAGADAAVPLCVDLDGTLVRSDLLLESVMRLARARPLALLRVPLWLARGGKARLKHEIARRVDLAGLKLPYDEEVLEFVRAERARRRTVLVTGSHRSIAEAVAADTDAFDEVRGTDRATNLTGERKRAWLVERFGRGGFDYIGNDRDDLAVWPAAREALAVSRPGGIASSPGQTFARVFERPRPGARELASMLRVHHWSKNLLVFVPWVLDHRLGDPASLATAALAFLAISLLASATYILNDLLDLEADRRNATKSRRVFASGRVPIATGVAVGVALVGLAALICLALPAGFAAALGLYLVGTLAYSFALKARAIVDVLTIAALHTLRVVAGTFAIGAPFTFWPLAFSMFFFLSLALAKRVAELGNLERAGIASAMSRGYLVADKPFLVSMGTATGFVSVLVIALYADSERGNEMYAQPEALWLVCPVLMYWIGRIWLLTTRGRMHEDPLVFAARDRASWAVAGAFALVLGWALLS